MFLATLNKLSTLLSEGTTKITLVLHNKPGHMLSLHMQFLYLTWTISHERNVPFDCPKEPIPPTGNPNSNLRGAVM